MSQLLTVCVWYIGANILWHCIHESVFHGNQPSEGLHTWSWGVTGCTHLRALYSCSASVCGQRLGTWSPGGALSDISWRSTCPRSLGWGSQGQGPETSPQSATWALNDCDCASNTPPHNSDARMLSKQFHGVTQGVSHNNTPSTPFHLLKSEPEQIALPGQAGEAECSVLVLGIEENNLFPFAHDPDPSNGLKTSFLCVGYQSVTTEFWGWSRRWRGEGGLVVLPHDHLGCDSPHQQGLKMSTMHELDQEC